MTTRRTIRVDRLRVRLRGVDAEAARAMAHGLPPEILEQIAAHRVLARRRGQASLDSLRLGPLPVPAGAGAGALRARVANAVAEGIASRPGGVTEA